MIAPFLIRHRDGREFELSDLAEFHRTYQPAGFYIVEAQPGGREVPATATDADTSPKAAAKAEAKAAVEQAQADATDAVVDEKPAPKKAAKKADDAAE